MSQLIKTVATWPVQELEIDLFDEADAVQPSSWQHYKTLCDRTADAEPSRGGSTIWVCTLGSIEAAIAWDWVELTSGVLALADPNALVSNLRFVGPVRGLERLDAELGKILLLNTIVHGLNWQDRVLAELGDAHPAGRAAIHSSALH